MEGALVGIFPAFVQLSGGFSEAFCGVRSWQLFMISPFMSIQVRGCDLGGS